MKIDQYINLIINKKDTKYIKTKKKFPKKRF